MSSARNTHGPSGHRSSRNMTSRTDLTNNSPNTDYASNTRAASANRQPESQYVDLTADTGTHHTNQHRSGSARHVELGTASRGPRFANDIIDVDGNSTRPQNHRAAGSNTTQIDNDGFEILGQRQVPMHLRLGVHHILPPASPYPTLRRLSTAQRNAVGSLIQTIARNVPLGLGSFMAPSLDYSSVPFNFGLPETPVPEPVVDTVNRYHSPQAAPSGFTYTPDEHDAYVCPNCDEELRTGESDVERQVWVIKACGHAYCGQCAQHRSIAKHKKLKSPGKFKPFKQCVVDECTSKTTSVKSMVQIYI